MAWMTLEEWETVMNDMLDELNITDEQQRRRFIDMSMKAYKKLVHTPHPPLSEVLEVQDKLKKIEQELQEVVDKLKRRH